MESEHCKYCGMNGGHSPECPTQFTAEANKVLQSQKPKERTPLKEFDTEKDKKEISRSEKIVSTLTSLDKASSVYIESIKHALKFNDSDENKSLLLKIEQEGELYRSLIIDFKSSGQAYKTPSEVATDLETAIEETLRTIRIQKENNIEAKHSEGFLKFLEDKKELLQGFIKKA